MSPPGDPRTKQRTASAKAKSPNRGFAFPRSDGALGSDNGGASHATFERGGGHATTSALPLPALPLRLSVAQGELGIELSSSIELGAVSLEEMDIALTGLKYPVDLSKGVKQFLSRRGLLRHTVVKIDLLRLAELWAHTLDEFWGEPTSVRLRIVSDPGVASATQKPPSPRAVGNDTGRPAAVSVLVHSEHAALAFDLVLSSGSEPRFVIDVPRAVGTLNLVCENTALFLALKTIELGLGQSTGGLAELKRRGRTLQISGFAQALTLAVLPNFGCRLPKIERHVVERVESTAGCLRLTLASTSEAFSAGRRALRVSGLADFTERADNLMALADIPHARAAFLESLDFAVGEPQILQELAEIDLSTPDRAESALAFLQECTNRMSTRDRALLQQAEHQEDGFESSDDNAANSRFELLMGRALLGAGRIDAAQEALRRALQLESNGVFASFLAAKLLTFETDPEQRESLLHLAVSRAPFLLSARWPRFEHAVASRDWRTALSDAEQIEALLTEPVGRCQACLKLGRAFLEHNQLEASGKWLKRALRLNPDEPEVLEQLALHFVQLGEKLRGAELMQGALRIWNDRIKEVSHQSDAQAGSSNVNALREKKMGVHFRLAQLLRELDAEPAQVLGHLRQVESRSFWGALARIVEAEIYASASRESERDQALLRIFEAIELGWITTEGCLPRIEALLAPLRNQASSALVEFADRVLSEQQAH